MTLSAISILIILTISGSLALPVRDKEKSELADFVNKNGNRSQGNCYCNIITLDCRCRVKSDGNSFTNFRLDVVQAALAVEDMKREDSESSPSQKQINEKRQWPPGTGYQFEDKRLGHLTGKEEPLSHLQIFPKTESEIRTNFTLFYRNMGSKTRPIALKSKQLTTKSTGSQQQQQIPFLQVPGHNRLIESSDRISLCNKIYTLIHGFRGSADDPQIADLMHALFHFHEYNDRHLACVLMVDWRQGASASSGSTYYAQAAVNTIAVGRLTGLLLHQLVFNREISPSDIHLIGFSLGAHVAHFASNWYQHLMRQQMNNNRLESGGVSNFQSLDRITGLDPAARHFQGYEGSFLTKGDASFVDIIHSSNVYHAGNYVDILHSRYGNPDPTGDVDFYPNGGDVPQPGCSGKGSSCSHNRAIDYFIDSLNASLDRNTRIAIPCDSYEHFAACHKAYFAANSRFQNTIPALTVSSDKLAVVKSLSYMGYEAEVFPGRGKMFLHYTPTHAGYLL